MVRNLEAENLARQRTVTEAIEQLSGVFNMNPFRFFREAELHSYLYHLLMGDPRFSCQAAWGDRSLLHQEYPTPFKCSMAGGRFEVRADNSRFRRGHYDLVVLDPWWIDKAPLRAVMGVPFQVLCEQIRQKAHDDDPPFCLVAVEMYLMRYDKLTQSRLKLIRQDYRKLLSSRRLPKLVSKGKKWRFTGHRYMLVYSHFVEPDHEQSAELCSVPPDEDVDAENMWMVWTSPKGTRWSD